MKTGFEANSFVVKLARAVPGNLFEEALVKPARAVFGLSSSFGNWSLFVVWELDFVMKNVKETCRFERLTASGSAGGTLLRTSFATDK